jgi:hypothetical protein
MTNATIKLALSGKKDDCSFNYPRQSTRTRVMGTSKDAAMLRELQSHSSYSGAYLAYLYVQAAAWSSEFRQIVTKLAVVSGCRLEVPSGREFDGIKHPGRTVEKVCRVYGGHCDRVLDLLRATVVADDVSQMLKAFELLTSGFDERVTVRRVKNKFHHAVRRVKGGFRNVHLNLMLRRPGSIIPGFICELQIQHREMWEAEGGLRSSITVVDGRETTPHDRYIIFRNFRAE